MSSDFILFRDYDHFPMYTYKTLNAISPEGTDALDEAGFKVDENNFDALVLRSHKLSADEFSDNLKCIGRAGAGYNNIPVDEATKKGIVVFNTPGANANAVKELVVCGLLLASRGIVQGSVFSSSLESSDDNALNQSVEKAKKTFKGNEVQGKTLGIIGLGAIGSMVAQSAASLGMKIIGYDPHISIDAAWRLPSDVEKASSIPALLKKSDYISVHVPLIDDTRNLIDSDAFMAMKSGTKLINLSRGGIVNDEHALQALESGVLSAYVTDFPTKALIQRSQSNGDVILLPHLGASTHEAEVNCAFMAANQIKDYLVNGNVTNSVNFPPITLEKSTGNRILVINKNEPGMIGQIADKIADEGYNIEDMSNKSRDAIAINLIDVDKPVDQSSVNALSLIDHVLLVRSITH